MRYITLALTSYNRFELLMESFKYLIEDERVNEIIISDDASKLEIYDRIVDAVKDIPKVKTFRNISNRDCYQNKMCAVSLSTNEWVLLGDSDNIFMPDYINRIYDYEWDKNTLLAPVIAKPNFDYSAYSGLTITKENVSQYIEMPLFTTFLNTMNYFVNKHEYLRVWDGTFDPINSDSIFQNYNWLLNGNKIFVVPDLEYFHKVHNGHYQTNIHRSGNIYEKIKEKLKQLS